MIERLRRGVARELNRRLDALAARVAADRQLAQGARIEEALHRLHAEVEQHGRMLRAIVDDEAANRRRLWDLRAEPSYALAFEEDEPLVTVAVPTRNRAELLAERCLPSILGQTYERLEVLIVGDDATPSVEAVARGTGDDRVSFSNHTLRVVKPSWDEHWLAAATMPRNEAYRRARGRWTMDFDDDDALRPTAVADLVALAKHTRAEVAYGRLVRHDPDGTETVAGEFPPELSRFSLSGALVHTGLRFFAREHVASALRIPSDWYRAERMIRTGVRFADTDAIVMDYYPAKLWRPRELARHR